MAVECRKSNSDQNVLFTYVCLVNDLTAKQNKLGNDRASFVDDDEIDEKEDLAIRVEKSKALHELVETHKENHDKIAINTGNASNVEKNKYTSIPHFGDDITDDCDNGNPNLIKLTKMKWLTEKEDGSPDSSVASLSVCSLDSEEDSEDSYCSEESMTDSDRHLSTILQLDKEHNLFGLSSHMNTLVKRPPKRTPKPDKPVFHQTQIVQVCCADNCCINRSNTSFPSSLQCIGCSTSCFNHSMCNLCEKTSTITSKIVFEPKTSKYHSTCQSASCRKSSRKKQVNTARPYNTYCSPPMRCGFECNSPYGLKVYLNRQVKHEVEPLQISPKGSSILQKPLAARPCNHNPRCSPPSTCFPFLMPCYWPASTSAPCSHPSKCFHNPPCPPPRCPTVPEEFMCPHLDPCPNKRECIYNTCLSKSAKVQEEAKCFKDPTGKSGRRTGSPPRKSPSQGKGTSRESRGSLERGGTKSLSSTAHKGSSQSQKSQQSAPPPQPMEEMDAAEGYADALTQAGHTGHNNNIATLGNPYMGQAASQASQGINEAAAQGNQYMGQVASQAGQGVKEAAALGNQVMGQAANQGSPAQVASRQGSQTANQGKPPPQ